MIATSPASAGRCAPPIRRGWSRASRSRRARAARRAKSPAGRRKSRRPSMSNTMILRRLRRALAHGQDLVELLLVLHEQELGVAVVDEIFDLRRRVGRIDAGGDAAGAQDAASRRTATPCCCRRGWRRSSPGCSPRAIRPSRSRWRARRSRARCRPSRCRDPSRATRPCRRASSTRCQKQPRHRVPSMATSVGRNAFIVSRPLAWSAAIPRQPFIAISRSDSSMALARPQAVGQRQSLRRPLASVMSRSLAPVLRALPALLPAHAVSS